MDLATVAMERTLPQNIKAERALLGAVLRDNSVLGENRVSTMKSNEFYRDSNRRIFERMLELHDQGSHIDPVTLAHQLTKHGELDEIGGEPYLNFLVSEGDPAGAADYANIIHDESVKRNLIFALNKCLTRAYEDQDPSHVLVLDAIGDVRKLADDALVTGPEPIKSFLGDFLNLVEARRSKQQMVYGSPSGFLDLDEMTGGFKKGDLVVVGGRPTMGKSSLLENILAHSTLSLREKVLMFSFEGSKQSVLDRLVCSESQIDSHRFRGGFLAQKDYGRISATLEGLNGASIYIDDTPRLTIEAMLLRAEHLAEKIGGLDKIIVDHFHLIDPVERPGQSRNDELAPISRGLKLMAKSLNTSVIAAAQLSRKPDERKDHRPILSDLRDTGTLEQDADTVILIYRDDVYDHDPNNPEAGTAELIVAKQRNGPTGVVRLAYLREQTRFANLAVGG